MQRNIMATMGQVKAFPQTNDSSELKIRMLVFSQSPSTKISMSAQRGIEHNSMLVFSCLMNHRESIYYGLHANGFTSCPFSSIGKSPLPSFHLTLAGVLGTRKTTFHTNTLVYVFRECLRCFLLAMSLKLHPCSIGGMISRLGFHSNFMALG